VGAYCVAADWPGFSGSGRRLLTDTHGISRLVVMPIEGRADDCFTEDGEAQNPEKKIEVKAAA
jgi:hypothetical protein